MIDIEHIANEIIKIIGATPITIHLDMIGLYKLGKTNDERVNNFRKILLSVESKGGSILIPVYSMSYTRKEQYSIKNSPSVVGFTTQWLLEKDYKRRTSDPIFSYLLYSKDKSLLKHLDIIKQYNSFGENGIIKELYKSNAYLGTIGCGVKMLSEIYLIENQRGCSYRKNKSFNGQTMLLDDEIINTEAIYFCRYIEKYPKLISEFGKLQNDLLKEKVVHNINIDNKLLIFTIQFEKLNEFILEKTSSDEYYLTNHQKL